MRVLIVDEQYQGLGGQNKRVEDIIRILSTQISPEDIAWIKKPGDHIEDDLRDIGFVMFHFHNQHGEGKNAFAFLEGLFLNSSQDSFTKLQHNYFQLGVNISNTGSIPQVLMYSGGGILEMYKKGLSQYGQKVLIREYVRESFYKDLKRSLRKGSIDVQILCNNQAELLKQVEYLRSFTILCQVYLVTHYEICKKKKRRVPPEAIRALEQMGWVDADLRSEPILSTLQARIAREGELIYTPAWWLEPLGLLNKRKGLARNKLGSFHKRINEEWMDISNEEMPAQVRSLLDGILGEPDKDFSIAVANAYCIIAQALGAKPCKT